MQSCIDAVPTSISLNRDVPAQQLGQRRRWRSVLEPARRLRAARAPAVRDRAPDRSGGTSAGPPGASRRSRPAPRSSRSRSAISKPSVVSVIAFSRSRASSTAATGRQSSRRLVDDRVRRGRAADATATDQTARHARRSSRGIRHVDADLDDRRRDQQLDLPGGERLHHPVLGVAPSCGRAAGRPRTPGNTSCAR